MLKTQSQNHVSDQSTTKFKYLQRVLVPNKHKPNNPIYFDFMFQHRIVIRIDSIIIQPDKCNYVLSINYDYC